jgi:hypothetical protein
MDYRPGALMGLTIFVVAVAGSSQIRAWQTEGVYPGFAQPDMPGYRTNDLDYDRGGYAGSFPSADRYPVHNFRPLKREAQAPELVPGYRFRERRPSRPTQAPSRAVEFNGVPRRRGYDSGLITSAEQRYSAPFSARFYPRWTGTAPVIRPDQRPERRNTRAVFQEISGSGYLDESRGFWPDSADYGFVEPGLTTLWTSENRTSHTGTWNWSSTVPSRSENYRMWDFRNREK